MNKVNILLLGKAASGKDYSAKKLKELFGDRANLVISNTTRPKRKGEVDGIDYNFISLGEFLKKIDEKKMLEYSEFNNWFYGTDEDALSGEINIAVVNRLGVENMIRNTWRNNSFIIIVLCEPFWNRAIRYVRRGGFSFEMIRRFWTDFLDFWGASFWKNRPRPYKNMKVGKVYFKNMWNDHNVVYLYLRSKDIEKYFDDIQYLAEAMI